MVDCQNLDPASSCFPINNSLFWYLGSTFKESPIWECVKHHKCANEHPEKRGNQFINIASGNSWWLNANQPKRMVGNPFQSRRFCSVWGRPIDIYIFRIYNLCLPANIFILSNITQVAQGWTFCLDAASGTQILCMPVFRRCFSVPKLSSLMAFPQVKQGQWQDQCSGCRSLLCGFLGEPNDFPNELPQGKAIWDLQAVLTAVIHQVLSRNDF